MVSGNLTQPEPKVLKTEHGQKSTILWISRHGILYKEMKALNKIHGNNLVVKSIESQNLKATDVLRYIKKFKPVEVVAVLPLEIIKILMANGIFPIYAIMDNVTNEHESDVIYDGYKCRKFVRFVRYKNIKFNYFENTKETLVMNPYLGHKPISDTILLFSYRRTHLSEIERHHLRELYGDKQLKFVFKNKNTDLALLAKDIRNNKYLDVIVEAPQSVLTKLTKNNVNPLIVQKHKASDNEVHDFVYSNDKKYIFDEYKRLKSLKVEFTNIKNTNLVGEILY